ncbi:MAG: Ig-like domain-containing protein [Clostridia bacterium]|nr:Ig-like domain-containing protein [Clostridia bacterium]
MKKIKKGMLWTVISAVLSFVMIFSLAACNTNNGGSNGLMLNTYTLTIDEGGQSPLAVTTTVLDGAVDWSSSDESVATVTGSGTDNRRCMIDAHKIGTATITAKSGDKSATCAVTVVAAEVITITNNGAEVKGDISLSGAGAVTQLAASSSRGHDIVLSCDKNDLIATVDSNGRVTAVATSGTVTVTATCAQHSNVSSSVTVKVGSGVDSAYAIQQGDENGTYGNPYNSNANPGTWIYWNQYGNVSDPVYKEGVIEFKTVNIDPNNVIWHNVQFFYTAPASAKLEKGKLYEVTFDFELERYNVDEEGNEVVESDDDWSGRITVNGYVVTVKDGENHCTAYYEHNVTAFSMQLGVEYVGCDIANANIKLSNVQWKVAQPVQLQAPSFTIANNKITITDTNPKGSVGNYTLNLYNDAGVKVGGVLVENGKDIDTSKINAKGTFTAQIVANSKSANYITALESNVNANNTVTISHEHSQYNMENGGAGMALLEVGTWTYWHESWVAFNGKVTDGVATVTFSNNSGNWYDTQLFYKIPELNKDDKYNAKLHINNVPNKGRVSINGHVYELQAGDNEIDLKTLLGASATSFTEGTMDNGTSITIVFGVDGESKKQEIQATTGTGIVVYLDGLVKVQETV